MPERSETKPPADEGRIDRRTRAHDPERAAFEAWWRKAYHPAKLERQEHGCYLELSAGIAWDAWQAGYAQGRKRAVALTRTELHQLLDYAQHCESAAPN